MVRRGQRFESVGGLGRVFFEAFARGQGVVATDGGGIPDVVTDEQNGLLVPPYNEKALREPMRRMLSIGHSQSGWEPPLPLQTGRACGRVNGLFRAFSEPQRHVDLDWVALP